MIEFKDFITAVNNKKLPIREQYRMDLILKIGQIVEDSDGSYEVLDRGTNYITVSNKFGELKKKFIDRVSYIGESTRYESIDSFKGYFLVKASTDMEIAEAFTNTVSKYNNGDITDAVAILKSMQFVDSENYSSARIALNRINELSYHTYLDK